MEDSGSYDLALMPYDNDMTTRCEASEPSTIIGNACSNPERSTQHTTIGQVDSNAASLTQKPPSQQSSFFPIRLLSTELLQLIFLFAAYDKPHGFATYIKKSALEPRRKQSWAGALSLSWVCSSWRRVALSYPVIWCSIHITAGLYWTEDSVTHPGFAEFVGECLRRSGQHLPLDIGLHLNAYDMWLYSDELQLDKQNKNQAETLKVLSHVADYAGRLRQFKIRSNLPMACRQFTDIIAAKMAARPTSNSTTTAASLPYLEEIEFVVLYDSSDPIDHDNPFQQLFSVTTCPSLRNLGLYSLRSTDAFDLKNLVFLRTSHYSGHSFGSLLEQCPHLKYMSMDYLYMDPPSSAPAPPKLPIVHTHLTRLCLTKIGDWFPLGVWNDVSLPNLTQLGVAFQLQAYWQDDDAIELPSPYFEGPNALEELKLMCIRSGCLLQKIWISDRTCGARIPSRMHSIVREFPRSQSPNCTTEICEWLEGMEWEAYLEYLGELPVRSC
ncbi:hypothetical protein EV361DRAFT_884293 [Lentinula raphanica]|nr:hypothetical protein FB446DRAFT_715279 [Lentinula raphanica]KAJ3818957.1 hypothetical protein F5880DRAFT_1597043 [Lentinula raphanica]KAJ3976294.1 hypothetical protein EV361DRAFT_884293 [Lentinula raphanica]